MVLLTSSIKNSSKLIHSPKIYIYILWHNIICVFLGLFTIIRGLDSLGENFALPTCTGFYNIFHPYDPIAYRTESLIHPDLGQLKPVLIPHHKGRKRMHLGKVFKTKSNVF